MHQFIRQPKWITEGVYLHWIDDLLDAADVIVWLDLPWYISLPQVVRRHVTLSLAGQNRHPGVGKLVRFVWHCRRFYTQKEIHIPVILDDDRAINRLTMANYLIRWNSKVIHCRAPVDVEEFVQQRINRKIGL